MCFNWEIVGTDSQACVGRNPLSPACARRSWSSARAQPLGNAPRVGFAYRPFSDEEFGDEVLWDTFNVEIYNDEVGSYDLGEGMNRSYATCEVCVLINVGSQVFVGTR